MKAASATTCQGFSLLGCPVGPPSFCEESFGQRIAKIKSVLDCLHDLGDAQLETTLLRSCLSLPKVSYVLRTCPPNNIRHGLSVFNNAIRDSLGCILGLSDWSWSKASLPCRLGGLNLQGALLHAPAVFIDSNICSSSLVEKLIRYPAGVSPHVSSSVAEVAKAAAHPEWLSLEDIDVPFRQRALPLRGD